MRIRRPDVIPVRMLEPELVEPPSRTASAIQPQSILSLRLLDTQARGHIGHRLLHQQASGELTEDHVWRWSSTPDRYLDSALRLALASSPDVRLVGTANAPAMAVTLLVWQLNLASSQLVGAIELSVTAADRSVRTEMIRRSEPVSAELPGNLAVAAGRLLQSLASKSVARGIQAASPKYRRMLFVQQLYPTRTLVVAQGRCACRVPIEPRRGFTAGNKPLNGLRLTNEFELLTP